MESKMVTGMELQVQGLQEKFENLQNELGRVVLGQEAVINTLLIALFGRGHALLIGVPGLAKTLLVKSLASALGWHFNRIQFTPDLMPSDITGTEILQTDAATGDRQLKLVKGPIFANLILADEINRTPPKTQAALLEAMEEHSVTIGGETMGLEEPFTVVATQNPIEQEGTYPLPEAQLDRFMFSIEVDYPGLDDEITIADQTTSTGLPDVRSVFSKEEFLEFQRLVRTVPVSRHIAEYAVQIVRASRPKERDARKFIKEYVAWGAGPRASQYLILGAKIRAILSGRSSPSSHDVQEIAYPVLRHRIIPNYHAAGNDVTASVLIEELLRTVKEPAYQE